MWLTEIYWVLQTCKNKHDLVIWSFLNARRKERVPWDLNEQLLGENSSGGRIQCTSFYTVDATPCCPPPAWHLLSVTLFSYTWWISLPHVSLKTMGTPMHSVSPLNYRFPLHMLQHICSKPLLCISLQLLCWLQCSWWTRWSHSLWMSGNGKQSRHPAKFCLFIFHDSALTST